MPAHSGGPPPRLYPVPPGTERFTGVCGFALQQCKLLTCNILRRVEQKHLCGREGGEAGRPAGLGFGTGPWALYSSGLASTQRLGEQGLP